MPADFELTLQPGGDGVQVVAVRGEIDLFTAPELKQSLNEVLEGQTTGIVVDLTETTFLDSTALGVLIGAVKRARGQGGELVVVNTDETIAKTFQITGLDQIFTLRASREEAVESIARGPETEEQPA